MARSAPDQIRSVRRYVQGIEENLDRGRGLWIQGDVGTGKTTLAMLVSKAALDAGRSVAILLAPAPAVTCCANRWTRKRA